MAFYSVLESEILYCSILGRRLEGIGRYIIQGRECNRVKQGEIRESTAIGFDSGREDNRRLTTCVSVVTSVQFINRYKGRFGFIHCCLLYGI